VARSFVASNGIVTRTSSHIPKLVAALALALFAVRGTTWALAQAETVEPKVAARAWALTDLASGEYLAGEDASERLPMGSTDKIMVALVALEQAEAGQPNLGEEVTVSTDAAAFAVPFYSNVGLLASA
jgi:D-alanyl-D-alanine carboxypeptidase